MSKIFIDWCFWGGCSLNWSNQIDQIINKSVFIPAYLQCALEVLDSFNQDSKSVDFVCITLTIFCFCFTFQTVGILGYRQR